MAPPVSVAPTFFNPRTRPPSQRWLASAIAWAIAAALTIGAAPATAGVKFVFFWIAVLFAAWVGGIGVAAVAALAAAVLVGVLRHQAGMARTDEVVTIVLWLVPVAFGSILASTLASQSSALARYAVELQRAVESARTAGLALEEQRAALERSNELLQEQATELELQAEELQVNAQALEERSEAEARARLLLAANEARYRSLAEAVPVQVWTARPDGRLDFVSEHTAAYFGVPAQALLDDGWSRLVHPEDLPTAIEHWTHALATGRPYQAEFRLRAPDGSYRWHLARAVPERDPSGSIIGWVGSNTDMQDERAARAEAETANRAKAEFLTVMSHELRTPLNAIGGYAELIEMGVHGPVTDEQRVALERIQRSQRHLLGLINGVLNYAKVDAGAVVYEFAPVPMHDVLSTCEALTAPQVRTKRIQFRYEGCDPALRSHADREKVQQIVLNLLSNAVKFTEPGGCVTLECMPGDAYHLLVRVSDTGRGIADDQLERIFQPFVQVDAALTRTASGTGLGLAISRDLARGMGGDLTVASAPGVGSTFTLSLMVE